MYIFWGLFALMLGVVVGSGLAIVLSDEDTNDDIYD